MPYIYAHTRGQPWVLILWSYLPCFGNRVSYRNPGHTDYIWLTGPQAPGIILSLPLQQWDCRQAGEHLWLMSMDGKLGPRACSTDTLHAEPSPKSSNSFKPGIWPMQDQGHP